MSNEETPASEPSNPIAIVTSYLDERGFTYTVHPELNRISHTVWGKCTLYRSEIRITHEDRLFQAHIYFPIAVRDEKFRSSANELLTRANYGLPIGNFEFDCNDGEVRFHVSHPIGSYPLEKELIAHLLRTSVRTADRYFPALVQHLYAGITPEDAVYTAELDVHAANVVETPRSPSGDPKNPDQETSRVDPPAE